IPGARLAFVHIAPDTIDVRALALPNALPILEFVVAVGQAALARRRAGPGGAAVAGNFIGDADAVGVGVAAEAEAERVVGGDRDGVGRAAVGEAGKGQSPGESGRAAGRELEHSAVRGIAVR